MAGQVVNQQAFPALQIKEIKDGDTRRNFQSLSDYFLKQNQLVNFKFFELSYSKAADNVLVPHGLPFIPQDILVTKITGAGSVTFNYSSFTSTNINLSVSGACRIRFFVGTYWNFVSSLVDASSDKATYYSQVLDDDSSASTSTSTTTSTTTIITTSTTPLWAVKTITSNYSATVDDDLILCSGGALKVTLPSAVGNMGKVIRVKKTDAVLANIMTVATVSGQTIDSNGATFKINTINEMASFVSDNSNWKIVERLIPSVWTSWTVSGTWTANTAYQGEYRRINDSFEGSVSITLSGAPTATALKIALPSPLTPDVSKIVTFVPILGRTIIEQSLTTNVYHGRMSIDVNTNKMTVGYFIVASPRLDNSSVSATAPITFAANDTVNLNFLTPIVGWS